MLSTTPAQPGAPWSPRSPGGVVHAGGTWTRQTGPVIQQVQNSSESARAMHQLIEAMPTSQDDLDIIEHRSQLIITKANVVRLAIADQSILDVAQYSPRELSLIGLARGSTTLHDAVLLGSVLARVEAGGRPSVFLLFTDGMETTSWTTARDAVDAVRRSDVVIYPVGAGLPVAVLGQPTSAYFTSPTWTAPKTRRHRGPTSRRRARRLRHSTTKRHCACCAAAPSSPRPPGIATRFRCAKAS